MRFLALLTLVLRFALYSKKNRGGGKRPRNGGPGPIKNVEGAQNKTRDTAEAGRPRYEASPKHGQTQRGKAAPAPTNGQEALDRSVPIKETTTRRVSADPKTGELVVFDETYPGSGIYHGHVRPWSGPDGLSPAMQAALRKAGLVNSKGKVVDK